MAEQGFIDKLAWIFIVEKKVLCVVSKGKTTYYLPGGKREEGETDEQALAREIKEELSIDLLPETIRLVGVFEAQADGKPEGVQVRMTCHTAAFSGSLTPAAEIAGLAWLGCAEKSRTSLVTQHVFDWLHAQGLIE